MNTGNMRILPRGRKFFLGLKFFWVRVREIRKKSQIVRRARDPPTRGNKEFSPLVDSQPSPKFTQRVVKITKLMLELPGTRLKATLARNPPHTRVTTRNSGKTSRLCG